MKYFGVLKELLVGCCSQREDTHGKMAKRPGWRVWQVSGREEHHRPCTRVCQESSGKPHFRKITGNNVVMRNVECLN